MWSPLFLLFSLVIPAITVTLPDVSSCDGSVQTFNSTVSSGPSHTKFNITCPECLDGPKLSSVNSSVFDWWYFDAVSEDQKSSFVIIFFTSTADAFPFLKPVDNPLPVWIWASFPNGSVSTFSPFANQATIKTRGDGSEGKYEPLGMAWSGAPDLSSYLITVDNAEIGVKGTFHIKSIAPAHYPSGPPRPNMNTEIIPHVGWANAIPDGVGTVDMVVEGSRLQFQGSAYHDKNWSDRPITQSSKTWYWGHTRVGPYSVVWFYAISPTEAVYASGYISKDGKILHSGTSGVKVYPVNDTDGNDSDESADSDIPEGLPKGFRVEFHIDSRRNIEGVQPALALDVKVGQVIGHAGTEYARWMGNSTGCVFHQCELSGGAIFEQIDFS